MIYGLSVSAFTTLHVILSLVGIAAGLVVVAGMLRSALLPASTALYLATTILTSATGFLFPRDQVLPSHIFGVLSLVALTLAVTALYQYRLAGPWRQVYVSAAIVALYLNVFVAVVQAFIKLPFLNPLAPTQTEPPFFLAQFVVLVAFIGLAIAALRSFRPSVP